MNGLRIEGIKNFSRAVDEPQEMKQLISGQSNGGLYRGGGIDLSFKNMQEFFKVEGYLQQKEHVGKGGYQRAGYFNKLVQVKSNWSLKCVWQNGES